jgi:hypothetical protein
MMIIVIVKTIHQKPYAMAHETYKEIIRLVKSKKLKEPFYPKDIVKAAPKINSGTSRTFPIRHRKGNPGGNSELFVQLKNGGYKLIKPYKYGLK